MAKRTIVVLLVLLFLVAFSIPFFGDGIIGEVIYGGMGPYNYTGLNDQVYYFEKTKTGNTIWHVLDYKIAKPSSKGGFTHVRFAKIPFEYSPEELEGIPMGYLRKEILFSEVIYITRDKEIDNVHLSPVAIPTIGRVLDSVWDSTTHVFEIPALMAVTSPSEGDASPVITCRQSTPERRIVEFRKGSENKIYQEGECIILEFKDKEGSVKVATKLTYHILGIM